MQQVIEVGMLKPHVHEVAPRRSTSFILFVLYLL